MRGTRKILLAGVRSILLLAGVAFLGFLAGMSTVVTVVPTDSLTTYELKEVAQKQIESPASKSTHKQKTQLIKEEAFKAAEIKTMNANTYSSSHKWNILLTVNDGFFDFFQNWFVFYKKLVLPLAITIIAEDDIVYSKLKKACPYCSVLRSELNVTDAADFKMEHYKMIVSSRPLHILHLLEKGKNVVYADIDAVWLHNPLMYFNTSVDFVFQLDSPNHFCTGFMAIKSNQNTIKVIQQWHDLMIENPNVNQRTFNKVFRANNHTVTYQALNTTLFPSGKQYFELFNVTQRADVVIVHNNWIVGHDVKVQRFKDVNLWVV
ncbi:hypothetical protein ACF0H5_020318 [Mactra antiquata]